MPFCTGTMANSSPSLEPAGASSQENPVVFAHHHRRLQAALAAMRIAPDLSALYPIIARTIAALSGFDRVMVYRFDPDWHGEVVGEALSSPDVDSYLGLHYPASDIPRAGPHALRKELAVG